MQRKEGRPPLSHDNSMLEKISKKPQDQVFRLDHRKTAPRQYLFLAASILALVGVITIFRFLHDPQANLEIWTNQLRSDSNSLTERNLQHFIDESNDTCINIGTCLDPCACARQNHISQQKICRNDAGYIDYLQMHYCTFANVPAVSIGLMIVWLVFMIYLMISTTEDFFTPAMAKISEKLRFSGNVTGVTLLAFGNGSPDVFSAVTAITHGAYALGFASLIGGAVFVSTIVLAAICFSAKVTDVPRRPFFRDMFVFLLVVIAFLFAVQDGEIHLWESSLFVSFYLVYVVGVIVSRFLYQRTKKRRREALGIIEDINGDMGWESSLEDETTYPMLAEAAFAENMRSWKQEKRKNHGELFFGLEDKSPKSVIRTWIFKFSTATGWQEKNLSAKLFYLIVSPSILIRNLTIPRVGDGDWNRFFGVMNPIFIPLFVLFATKNFTYEIMAGNFGIPIAVIIAVVGVVVAAVVFFTTSNEEPPRYHWVYIIVAFLLAACWMYLIATEIVTCLRALGRIVRISESVLGFTVVAWGNSIVDLIADVIVAKQGFTGMAVSATSGAPTFNFLIGGGLAVLVVNAVNYPAPLQVEFTMHMLILFIFLGISILTSLVGIPVFKFSPGKIFGVMMVVVYAGLLLFGALVEMHVIPH